MEKSNLIEMPNPKPKPVQKTVDLRLLPESLGGPLSQVAAAMQGLRMAPSPAHAVQGLSGAVQGLLGAMLGLMAETYPDCVIENMAETPKEGEH